MEKKSFHDSEGPKGQQGAPAQKKLSPRLRGARASAAKQRSVLKKGSPSKPSQPTLKFIPLGGLGEIGKNMYVLEYGDDMIVIDSGLMFPNEDMLGIDFVIPDTTYLDENRHKIRAILLTHGHEDHVGALPFVLPKYDVPLYGTRLTLAMVGAKLAESHPRYKPKMMEVQAGDRVQLGAFSVRFIAVCHSIPDAVAMAVETPLGTVIHTGDYKLDTTPVDGRGTDYAAFAELGRQGVLLLCADSTNAEREGFTKSERTLVGPLDRLLRTYRNRRVIISAFASNLNRVQLVLDAAARFNRKVAFAGRSMVSNVDLALRLGYLSAEPGIVIPIQEIDSHPPARLIVMTTGSQGEPFSGLVLMSKGEHHRVRLGAKDVVALFANPIPGNEKTVSSTINRLFELGCEVLYEREQGLHVSGHASREELKVLLDIVRPRYFVPVHGEYRMLVRHAQLAEAVGVPSKDIFLMQNGDVLSITNQGVHLRGRVPAGAVLVDGLALGTTEGSLLKERQELAESGVMVVSIALDGQGKLACDPHFESYGQIHLENAETMRREFTEVVRRTVRRGPWESDEALKRQIALRCKELLRKYIHSSSCVIPVISHIGG